MIRNTTSSVVEQRAVDQNEAISSKEAVVEGYMNTFPSTYAS